MIKDQGKTEQSTDIEGLPGEPSTDAGFHKRLAGLLGHEKSAAAFAKRAGISQSGFHRIEHGGEPGLRNLIAIANAAGVSVEWLATGQGPMQRESAAIKEGVSGRLAAAVLDYARDEITGRSSRKLADGFVLVPRYDVEASAGPGALTSDENIVDHMAFQEPWVRRVLRADPRNLALISAVGDSMEPAIRAGDLLLVDTGINEVIDDAIYVIASDGHLMVKRLQRFLNGAVSIKSDNPAYVEPTLSAEEAANAKVAGRVRWIGRLI